MVCMAYKSYLIKLCLKNKQLKHNVFLVILIKSNVLTEEKILLAKKYSNSTEVRGEKTKFSSSLFQILFFNPLVVACKLLVAAYGI